LKHVDSHPDQKLMMGHVFTGCQPELLQVFGSEEGSLSESTCDDYDAQSALGTILAQYKAQAKIPPSSDDGDFGQITNYGSY
jgi:hypothetical protein